MKWTQITVITSQESSEAVSNLLFELGAKGVQVTEVAAPRLRKSALILKRTGKDMAKPMSCDIKPSTWHITAYFPTDDLIGERVFRLKKLLNDLPNFGLSAEPARIEVKSFENKNWAEGWKSSFPPQKIGKRLLVSPTWHQIEKTPEQILIYLDPGMAFGTGYHPTTQLSLCLLEEVIKGGERVADIGAGSGILAIAAALLGAEKITAVDIDELVIPIGKKNAIQNGVREKIEFLQGDAFLDDIYDIIIANILTQIILPMIPNCGKYLKPNGLCIFSGILNKEIPQMEEALNENNFKIVKVLEKEDWVGLLVSRNAELK